MKIRVANLSSNLLVVPSPLNLTLTGGKSVVAVLKEQDWKAVQTSPAVQRLLQAKMLALVVEEAPVVPAAPAQAASPEPEPPKGESEPPASASAPESSVTKEAVTEEVAGEVAEDDVAKKKTKKQKPAKGW